ncbi:MAG: preprotein translocase subunit SecG [Clostridia bacterium]|nr:preprotein translocase subunit SecG [Clostridia bacterium]
MSVIDIVLSVLDIVFGILMVVLFLVQEGNDEGIGVIGGSTTDSYYSKTKGRSLEERLKRYTLIVAICFAATSVLLYLAVQRGF